MAHNNVPSTRIIHRFSALLAALHDGPLPRPELLARLDNVYPSGSSRRVMVDRDVTLLKQLGIQIEKSTTRPPIYTLHGGVPLYHAEDLQALTIIAHSFGDHHPYTPLIHALLAKLTKGVLVDQHHTNIAQRNAHAPLQPAIDYTRHYATLTRLDAAINGRELIAFTYRNSRGGLTAHRKVEPYNIEFYDRHFYLVAYSHNSGQIHDFRIDRIEKIASVLRLSPDHADHERPCITFRYRLAEPLARGEISQRFEQQRIVGYLANGDAIVEAEGRSDFFIIRTLLKYAGNAELLEPDWLRKQMHEEVRQIARIYGIDDGS